MAGYMSPSADVKTSLLIVCVDRDDDIGQKTKLRTPVVGRAECLDAASRLAVADPEEAYANAIFAAVKQFDELTGKGYKCQVSVVAGSATGGFEADQKLRRELETIAKTFPAEGAVLVSDGADDESILPALQTVIPVVSVRRIYIKHSKSVEESYVVLGRYLRMLISDPRFSKWALGIPGLILLTVGPLIYFDLLKEASAILAGIVGGTLLLKGFGVDRMFSALFTLRPSDFIRLFSILASLLIVVASLVQAYANLAVLPEFKSLLSNPYLLFQYGAYITGTFLGEAMDFLWIGLAVFFGGNLLHHFLRESVKVLREVMGLVILGLLYFPFQQFSLILRGVGSTQLLISFTLFGLAITFLVVGIVYQYIKNKRRPKV